MRQDVNRAEQQLLDGLTKTLRVDEPDKAKPAHARGAADPAAAGAGVGGARNSS